MRIDVRENPPDWYGTKTFDLDENREIVHCIWCDDVLGEYGEQMREDDRPVLCDNLPDGTRFGWSRGQRRVDGSVREERVIAYGGVKVRWVTGARIHIEPSEGLRARLSKDETEYENLRERLWKKGIESVGVISAPSWEADKPIIHVEK